MNATTEELIHTETELFGNRPGNLAGVHLTTDPLDAHYSRIGIILPAEDDMVDDDAVTLLKLDEARALHAALGRLIEQASV